MINFLRYEKPTYEMKKYVRAVDVHQSRTDKKYLTRLISTHIIELLTYHLVMVLSVCEFM